MGITMPLADKKSEIITEKEVAMQPLVLGDEIIQDREGRNVSIWWSALSGRVFRVEYATAPNWFQTETVEIAEVA